MTETSNRKRDTREKKKYSATTRRGRVGFFFFLILFFFLTTPITGKESVERGLGNKCEIWESESESDRTEAIVETKNRPTKDETNEKKKIKN